MYGIPYVWSGTYKIKSNKEFDDTFIYNIKLVKNELDLDQNQINYIKRLANYVRNVVYNRRTPQ